MDVTSLEQTAYAVVITQRSMQAYFEAQVFYYPYWTTEVDLKKQFKILCFAFPIAIYGL